ncbi:MAG: phytanoyl-CoA dioxygenase family protein, partial [Gammaproteobacteria bacterium]
MTRLSPAQLDSYRQDGYIVPHYRLAAEKVERLREALQRVVDANPTIRPEQLVSVHIHGLNAEGVHGDRAFLALCQDETILDMVTQLIGPDIILWGCQAFCKPQGDGMEVPFHQDGHYWPIRPLATCTAWVALDHSTKENGCLRLVPGSHRGQRLVEHQHDRRDGLTLNRRVSDAQLTEAEARAVDIELEPGQMSLHDIYMVHGSNPNRSGRRRAGIAIRYMPATSHFRRDLIPTSSKSGYKVDFATRPLWLLRGSDRTGKNDFEIGHVRAAETA